MMLRVYAVHDKAVEAFSNPFYQHTDAEAIRTFSSAVNDGKSPFGEHPWDYSLFLLGSWDNVLGVFDVNEPRLLIGAAQCLPTADVREVK